MGLSVFLMASAVVASVAAFVMVRKRRGVGAAAVVSVVTFVAIGSAMVLGLQFALSGMNG